MNRNEMKNTAAGVADELGGKLKKNVGKLIGNEQMEVEGAATELKGKAERAMNERTGLETSDLEGKIQNGMPVVCSEDGQFGVVDHLEGSEIKLQRDPNGLHHFIPLSWVTNVDSKVHIDRPGTQAMLEWRAER